MKEKKLNIPPMRQSMVANLPSPPQKKASDFLNAYNSWVYAAVNAIAQEVANIELHLYKKKYTRKGVELDEVIEHEALSLLYEVNEFMTHYQLFELTQIFLELTGEAYWLLLRDGKTGKPRQIWPLRPDWVFVNPSSNFIDSYKYSPGGLSDPNALTIAKEDIIPFKYPNPVNPYRGKGAVQAAAMAIDTDIFSAEWNRNFFFNAAVPYLILRTKKRVTQEELNRFTAEWEAKFQGKSNGHKIAMLGGGDWEEPFVFGGQFKDMDFIEQRRLMRDEILATFRVGKSILNITEDVNRANAEASNLNFMERVVTPKMTRFVAHLNEFLLRNWDDGDLFFDFRDPAPQDVQLNLQIYESAKGYWMTPNEIREKENLPPLEGGDVIPITFGSMPLSNLGDKTDDQDGDQDKGEEKQYYLYKKTGTKKVKKLMMPIPPKRLAQMKQEDLKNGIKRDLFALVKNLMNEAKQEKKVKRKNKKYKGRLNWSEEQKTMHWTKAIGRIEGYERKLLLTMKDLFEKQKNEVLANLEGEVKYWNRERRRTKAPSALFDKKKADVLFERSIRPLIKNIVEEEGKQSLSLLGITGSIDLSQKRAATFLGLRASEMIEKINEFTRDQIKQELTEGFEQQESIDQIKKRIEHVYDVAKGSRAVKIARTETLRGSNFGALEGYYQSRVVEAKEWLTARDGDVDPECAALEGTIRSLDASFDEGEFTGDYPPLHPNCRCTIIPVLKDETQTVRDDAEEAKVDFKDPESIKQLFDISEYDSLSQEARDTLVKKEFEKMFPNQKGFTDNFTWESKILSFKDVETNVAADPEKVQEYVDAFKDGEAFPTILATDLGGSIQILDGAHRSEALRKLGAKEFPLLIGIPK